MVQMNVTQDARIHNIALHLRMKSIMTLMTAISIVVDPTPMEMAAMIQDVT